MKLSATDINLIVCRISPLNCSGHADKFKGHVCKFGDLLGGNTSRVIGGRERA